MGWLLAVMLLLRLLAARVRCCPSLPASLSVRTLCAGAAVLRCCGKRGRGEFRTLGFREDCRSVLFALCCIAGTLLSIMEGKTLLERASNAVRAKNRVPVISPPSTFDSNHPQIKKDIIQMIAQYLESENYITAAGVVQDEANVKRNERLNQTAQLRRIRKGIKDGDWDSVRSERPQRQIVPAC